MTYLIVTMMNPIENFTIPLITSLMTVGFGSLFAYYIIKPRFSKENLESLVEELTAPMMQNVLNEIGPQIGGQINEMLGTPNVKRAMSILSKKGVDQKASNQLRNKVAENLVGNNPVVKGVLDSLGVTPVQALELKADPLFGPLIDKAINHFLSSKPSNKVEDINTTSVFDL